MTPSIALTNHGNGGNRHIHGLGYPFVGEPCFPKLCYLFGFVRGKFVKWGCVSKPLAFGINSTPSAFFGSVEHISRTTSLKKVVGVNTAGSVAVMANIIALIYGAFVENEARNVGTNRTATGLSFANIAVAAPVSVGLPKPAPIRFFNLFNKSAWQSSRAANGLQKFWSNVFGVKSPFDQFSMSHVTNL